MTDEARWNLLARKKSERAITEAFRTFRDHGIEPILIKGWAAARNYPPERSRFYGDTDLAVSSADFGRALELVERPDTPVRGVDLHNELRHLDTSPWERLFARSQLVDVDGVSVRILSAEDHLRVLCVHWLTGGGEDRERLLDIVYAVQNRGDAFDWSECLDVVSRERRSWIVCTIGLAHRYHGLSLEGLPFADEASKLPRWLTRSIENSWSNETRLRGLDESITDGSMFLRQMRKRIPPNPVQATVFCEGMFDDRSRMRYQVRDILGRVIPSFRRISKATANQYRWKKTDLK
jgi:hypothetical protein